MPWFSMSWTLRLDRRAGFDRDVLGADAEGVGALAAAAAAPSGSSKLFGATTAPPPATLPGSRLIAGEPTKLATKVSRGLV